MDQASHVRLLIRALVVLSSLSSIACARIGYELIDPVAEDPGALGEGGSPAQGGGGTESAGNSGTDSGGEDAGHAGESGSDGGSAGSSGAGGSAGSSEGGSSGASAAGAGSGGMASGGSASEGGNAGALSGGGGAVSGGTAGSAGAGGSGGTPCTPIGNGVEYCDGRDNDCSGVVDDAGACNTGCEGRVYSGTSYMYCATRVNAVTARSACAAENMRLARIEGPAENDLIQQWISFDAFLGGGDAAEEGTWRWEGGQIFWRGTQSGSAPFGVYTHFDTAQPDDNAVGPTSEDCLCIRANGYWNDRDCASSVHYLCERY